VRIRTEKSGVVIPQSISSHFCVAFFATPDLHEIGI
jgi:hypothetical protein